ncbi:SUMF1/EgtB/PvdO family nonheme iron enzyme [Fontisphaera persica]|uniref:SUMF1/EgtB/PvdO family nonheme iron enzyme n=1 Tax=Fontisphaera persica TaxID=2974023 RepID=UPI0024BF609C|nr:SUMF1/EgtB/PvdO family nonheme iron enzyme [Fontisphaera persica]WCJ59810.1 SUMF1/EgtB/PvdO family nonheme iron enzyme [Fontisphaera persica]
MNSRALGIGLALGWGWIGLLACSAEAATAGWAEALLAQRKAAMANAVVQESPWFTTGPLPAKSFEEALFPEHGVDLEARSADGKRRLWTQRDYPNGVVNDLRAGNSTSSYFYRTLVAKAGGPLRIGLGSDDGCEFWFNGEKVLSRDVPRGAGPDQDVVNVKLRPGTNTVLFKIYNRTGNCGFYYQSGVSSPSAVVAGLAAQYPREMALFSKYGQPARWLRQMDSTAVEQEVIGGLLKRLKEADAARERLQSLVSARTPPDNPAWLNLLVEVAGEVEAFERARGELERLNPAALRRAVEDLRTTYGEKYREGAEVLEELGRFEQELPKVKAALAAGERQALKVLQQYQALERRALLSNPALDFEEILLIKRQEGNLGLPQNWQGNTNLNPRMDNELVRMKVREENPVLRRVYKPAKDVFVGDVDLHYDGQKLLFSSIGSHGRWQVFEIHVDGTGLRQVTPGDEPDIDSYDAIYLPDERIIFDATTPFTGVPCVGGADYVANLHLMTPDGKHIRRLCFDQDNNWCPVMLPNGRVMYLRWEYTDSAHYFSRVLMSMNPDGTGQMEFYGSNSYWPNSLFYARPLPGSATKFVGIVSGHHGVPRMGELVLFDAARGRQSDAGAIQRIPGYGKPVKAVIRDALVDGSWPKFLHPFPLSDKHFLVACKPTPQAAWGIYLVDIYDNMLLLREEPGYALLEPVPLRKTERPPIIQDKVRPGATNAVVYLHNVYMGDGLKGVPPGTVKSLRLFQYEYSYRNMGGHYFIGMEGGWDVRRLIGTVPVQADGSALFNVPANTPIAIQPLDAEGKALQQMRSWFVGMPGEYVSCVGCHERQNQSSTLRNASAARSTPVDPQPWYGPKRGFSFLREVQPVLDRYCSGCHDGKDPSRPNLANTQIVGTTVGARLPVSYLNLHPFVRRNGPEGDYHVLTPLEFHADTSRLVQMLRKGHYNVRLDAEAWDRLITWIDLNVPAHGTFHEAGHIPSNFAQRRREAAIKYANVHEDIEEIPQPQPPRPAFQPPPPMPPRPAPVTLAGWPLSEAEARARQAQLGTVEMRLDLGGGQTLVCRRIPAGEFPMGDVQGEADEYPMKVVKIERPFWLGVMEVSLAQYQQFDPQHRNGYYDMHYKDQVKPGYLMDAPNLPVIRVSWEQAMAFCRWLSARTGKQVTLPTEAQWEWACRAGTATPMYYGDLNTDFALFANLADATLRQLAVQGVDPQPIPNPDKFWDFVPKDARFNDGVLHLAECGRYRPNAWGLHDMIGNVAEWTLDDYRPYPYTPTLLSPPTAQTRKVVRGGSWAERPKESRASSRLDYPVWQRVYNVGFRVAVLD